MSSDDELSSNTSSSCDVPVASISEVGRGRRRRDGGGLGGQRWYTLCDLRISIRKQGNRLKLVNYKNVMPSM